VRLKTFYLLAAIAGAVVPWLFFAGFFVEYGPGPYHARDPRRHADRIARTGRICAVMRDRYAPSSAVIHENPVYSG
jgi:hypothetical protein